MLTQFRWVIPDLLAGSGQPGFMSSLEEDWEFLLATGIRLVVTLTEDRLDPGPESFGVQGIHFPISDMGIPATPKAADGLCRTILAALEEGLPVLVHCKAGIGRTGTILACCLVALGRTPEDAVREIRRSNPSYIQTETQERFVGNYARYVERARVGEKTDGRGGREATV